MWTETSEHLITNYHWFDLIVKTNKMEEKS